MAKKKTAAKKVARKPLTKAQNPEAKNPVKEQMASNNFDPLLESIKIAKGEALTEDHPFLLVMEKWVRNMADKVEKKRYKIEREDLEDLLGQAEIALSDSWVPIALRATHIRDLLNYVYPKLKSTEHTGQIQHDMKVQPLTRAEINKFNKSFRDDY